MSEAGPGTPAPAASPAVFLERQGYRRRRLMDAARLLPLLGAALFALPLLWPDPESARAAGSEPVRMSDAILYVFAVWIALVVASFLFGMSARTWGQMDSPHGPKVDPRTRPGPGRGGDAG